MDYPDNLIVGLLLLLIAFEIWLSSTPRRQARKVQRLIEHLEESVDNFDDLVSDIETFCHRHGIERSDHQ